MKKVVRAAFALVLTIALSTSGGCKNNNENADNGTSTDMESTTMESTTTEQDTAAMVNDTNVSGTTSGEMEQVP